MREPVHGVSGAAIALVSIYLPSFLLIGAIVPFWNAILRDPRTLAALAGVNAAVVGLLFAAFVNPVWRSAILDPADIAIAAAAFALLFVWRVAPWIVVGLCALAAQLV
jgi:chromate transporter